MLSNTCYSTSAPTNKFKNTILVRHLISTITIILFSPGILDSTICTFYQKSLLESTLMICITIKLFIIVYVITPYIHESLGKKSVAQMMHDNYEVYIGYITAIASLGYLILFIALEIDLLYRLLYYFVVTHQYTTIFLTLSIIVLYLTVKSTSIHTLTNFLHFFTFGTLIPILFFLLLNKAGSKKLLHSITTTYTPDLLSKASILDSKFILGLIPISHPAIYQTLFMAASGQQARNALKMSFAICLFLMVISCFISILATITHPHISSHKLIVDIINYATYPEFKFLLIVSIIIVSLENINLLLHSSTLTINNDLYQLQIQSCRLGYIYRKIKFLSKFISFNKLTSYMLISISVILVFIDSIVVRAYILSCCYIYSAIFPFFIMGVFGFRTTNKVLISAICIGISSMLVSDILIYTTSFTKQHIFSQINQSLLLEFVTSITTILVSKYWFNIHGEWAQFSIKRTLYIKYMWQSQSIKLLEFMQTVPSVFDFSNIVVYCSNNNVFRYPKDYYKLVHFLMMLLAATIISVNRIYLLKFIWLVMPLAIVDLMLLTNLFLYQLWPLLFRQKYIAIICCITIFCNLIVTSTILLLISNINLTVMSCFIMNIIVTWSLVKWNIALFMTILGIPLGICIFKIMELLMIT